MLKHFYFVRHGQTDWNLLQKIQGWTDVPLNQNGEEQAESLAERILSLGIKISHIYSSPLIRAYRTAEIISSKLGGIEVIKNPLLKERCCGGLEGRCVSDFTEYEKENFYLIVEKTNGEGNKQIYERFCSFISQLPSDFDNVLIVSHGGFINVVIKSFSKEEISITNCCLISFDYDTETRNLSNFMCI